MAGRKDPAWPCYANDHLMDPDLLDLTPAEECAFFRLVSYLWANGPQPLSRLVKVAGMFRADAETVIRVVRLMMRVDDDEIVTSPRLEARRAPEPVVYVIADRGRGLLKIGTTSNLSRRLATLRRETGSDLRVIGTRPGSFAEERSAHERFAAARVQGEWFSDIDAIRSWIAGDGEGC